MFTQILNGEEIVKLKNSDETKLNVEKNCKPKNSPFFKRTKDTDKNNDK
jgi:hypothetical protein